MPELLGRETTPVLSGHRINFPFFAQTTRFLPLGSGASSPG